MSRNGDLSFPFLGQNLILTPERAVFWTDRRALVVADVHIGKSGHFRKHGIPVPEDINQGNLDRLDALVRHFEPREIIFLGDLFHSDQNSEWDDFKSWRTRYKDVLMHLALGNHDEHGFEDYQDLDLTSAYHLEFPPFLFRHIPEKIDGEALYMLSGHIHPSVKLKGRGRQALHVPCYYFGEDYALLPAFGEFTGNHKIQPQKNETVVAIVDDTVIPLN